MLRYIKHNQIDKRKWDYCISNASNGIIYAYSWYLDITCENWDAIVNEDYSSVMPVTKGKKYLMDYIYPPFFTQQLGIFSMHEINEQLCHDFLLAIPPVYRFIEMNLNIANKWVPSSYNMHRNTDYILTLGKSYDEIKKNYSDHHKRNLRKAHSNNLSLFRHQEIPVLIEMFRQNRGRYISTLKNENYNTLKVLIENAASRNMARVWSVHDDSGMPCAGCVFFESHQNGIFIFSSNTTRGKELGAMYFLIDQYIREFCVLLKSFDFEGSNNPELGRFYKGFGSEEFVYLQIKKNQLPPPWNWFKN